MAESSISINQYIDIFSTTAGGASASLREPIGRLFTRNELVPVGTTLAFTSASSVRSYFGASSVEYTVAYKYFNWVSKRFTQAKKISFDRVVAEPTAAAVISGINLGNALTSLKKAHFILSLTLGEDTYEIDADTSADTTLAEVATTLSTALGGTNGTITLNTTLNGTRFVLTAAAATDEQWVVSPTDDAALLGWTTATGIINSWGVPTAGVAAVDQIESILNRNNNCYTLACLFDLTNEEITAISAWVSDQNAMFMFCYADSKANLQNTIQPLVANYNGTWLQVDVTGEYQFWLPMAITANIDYTLPHASINFEFHQFPTDSATVFSDTVKTALDAVYINYLGRTQQAGKQISFLQEGWLQGTTHDAAIYVNEIWLKDSMITNLLTLFLKSGAIYANAADMSKMAGVCFDVFQQGTSNGVIQVGATLDDSEKATVEALTQDDTAYSIIEKQGYIFTYKAETLESGKKAFSYTLLYKAADTIRKVEGTHIGITSTSAA